MKVFVKMKDAITRRGLPNHRELIIRVRRSLVVLRHGLAQETVETKEMIAVYQRYTRGQATDEEMQLANQQFLDVIKGLGLSVVVILPFSPITLPAIVKLGSRVGIDVLPSAFRDVPESVVEEIAEPQAQAALAVEQVGEFQEVASDYSTLNSDPLKHVN